MRGQPDILIHQRSGNFSGLVIELKTPHGGQAWSPLSSGSGCTTWGRADYRALLSSSLEESIRILNKYMQSARVCCRHCGKSFAPERTLQTHEAHHHP